MRWVEIKGDLHSALDDLRVPDGFEGVKLPNGVQGHELRLPAGAVRRSLEHLLRVPPFRDAAGALLGNWILRTSQDVETLKGEPQHMQDLHSRLRELVAVARNLMTAVDELVPGEPEVRVAVLLPAVGSLNELQELIRQLQEIFDAPARHLLGAGVSFDGVESGSVWIDLAAANAAVLQFTVLLIRMAHRYATKSAEIERSKALSEELGITMAPTADALKALAGKLAKEIADQAEAPAIDNAVRAAGTHKLTEAVCMLGHLMIRGTEVRFALEAKPGIAAGAPESADYKQLAEAAKAFGLLPPRPPDK